MVILPGKEMEGACRDRGCLAHLDFVTLPEIERARDHGEALVLTVPVWRDLVPWRDHEANDERPRFARIALQNGDLRPLGNRRGRSAPFDVLCIDKALARSLSCHGSCKTPQNNRDQR